jgi:hypothetical protein
LLVSVSPLFKSNVAVADNPLGLEVSVPYTSEVGGCPYLANQTPTVYVNVTATAVNLSSTSLIVTLYYTWYQTGEPFNYSGNFSASNLAKLNQSHKTEPSILWGHTERDLWL